MIATMPPSTSVEGRLTCISASGIPAVVRGVGGVIFASCCERSIGTIGGSTGETRD
jgi:hypothetical protein